MEEKLFNLVRIIKKETSGYAGVKKINFEYKERNYILTEEGLYPLVEHAGIDLDLTNTLTDVLVKSMEF